ncbi:Bacterial conjugation TrbI-like protein [compost metagenome]
MQSIPTIRISRGDSESEDQAAFQQAFNPDAVQGAAVAGVGNALNRISEYYMDMAENLFPIIEIDAGRQIDFIIKKGASLKIKSVPKSKSS